ncbi:esterase/lipase family protein [Nocardia jejuensis]|uniref:esterase/lipase family protein n=1 Tax=Nocardia jejuensis TaxID=328049 RepID=UPI000829EACC|nr:alpha/beta fold hydrolase [Nocardia jejuensis]
MPKWRIGSLLCAAAVAVGAGAGPAQAELPVEYSTFSGIRAELTNPGGSLPGSNNWDCAPSAAHPNPVVLVHGGAGAGAQTNWGTIVPLLANEGYCVFALTYGALDLPWPISALGGMTGTSQQNAAVVGAFIERVLAATGARQVDIVGHSLGTLLPNYYAKRLGGASRIDRYVSFAPLWLGTFGDQLATARAYAAQLGVSSTLEALLEAQPTGKEAQTGSPMMVDLQSDGMYVPSITYTNIATTHDQVVLPYTSGLLPGDGVTNILLQDGCPQDTPDHLGIIADPRAAAYMLNALDPRHPRPVPCVAG